MTEQDGTGHAGPPRRVQDEARRAEDRLGQDGSAQSREEQEQVAQDALMEAHDSRHAAWDDAP